MQKPVRSNGKQTVINHIAPSEDRSKLVPLEKLEELESSRHWASVFASIVTGLVGAIICLVVLKYENTPFIISLGAAMLLFAFFALAFYSKSMRQLNETRKEALEKTGSEDSLKGISALRDILEHAIFREKEAISLSDFESAMRILLPQYDRSSLSILCIDGLLSIENATSDRPTIKYHREFASKKTAQTV